MARVQRKGAAPPKPYHPAGAPLSCCVHTEGGCNWEIAPGIPNTEYGKDYWKLKRLRTLAERQPGTAPYADAMLTALKAMRDYSGCFGACEQIKDDPEVLMVVPYSPRKKGPQAQDSDDNFDDNEDWLGTPAQNGHPTASVDGRPETEST